MSVDVFGRQLGRNEGTRGPPGFGFKLTTDGQYDVENKRLCNVAESREPSDAVNLSLAKRLIQQELDVLFRITTQHRTDLDDLQLRIQILEDEVKKRLQNIEESVKTILESVVHNSKYIASLTHHGTSESSGRAA